MKNIRIRRINLLSAANMSGCVGLFSGLLFAIVFSLFGLLGSQAPQDMFAQVGQKAQGGFQSVQVNGDFFSSFGVSSIFILPLLYGLTGFIGGFLYALAYNFTAGFTGGIEIETD